MGSFLQGLGALASAAGGALEGYGIDKRERVKAALVQAAEERAIEDQKIQRAAASQALKFGNFNALLQARSAGYRTPEENTGQLQQNLAPSFGPGLGGMGVSLPEDLPGAMQLTRGRGQMLDVPGQDMPMQFNATQTPDALKAEIERLQYERDQRGIALRDKALAQTAQGVATAKAQVDKAAAQRLSETEPVFTSMSDGRVLNVRTGEATGEARASRYKGGTAANQTKINKNESALMQIARAEAEVLRRPESFGLKFGVSIVPGMDRAEDPLNERTDPDGVSARAAVGNLNSIIVYNRSGTASSVKEYTTQSKFSPQIYNEPQTILDKLAMLRRQIMDDTEAFSIDPLTGAGYVIVPPEREKPEDPDFEQDWKSRVPTPPLGRVR